MNKARNLCNLMLQDADLKRLEQLDPFQTEGFHTFAKLSIPVKIIYSDELGKQTIDTQILSFQILPRWLRGGSQKSKQQPCLQSMRVIITSQEDIFLTFTCKYFVLLFLSCTQTTFASIKTKNQLNFNFSQFPATLSKLLKKSAINSPENKTRIELRLSHEGVSRLNICQDTDYKQLQLLQLFFQSGNLQKSHQSIIYRYNYNRTKLAMLQSSIDSIYQLLAEKNPPLLSYIQKTVGINE